MHISSNTLNYINNFCKEVIDNGTKIDRIYLFGSHANNSNHKDSDIDLALFSDDFVGFLPVDSIKFKHEIFRYYEIEPHTFKTEELYTNHFVKEEIIAKGIEIRINE